MKDRHLYRAKRTDNGEWVEGFIGINTFIPPEESGEKTYLGTVIKKVPEKIYDCESYEVDPSTICQCTGLKDKNGNLIWENDIVRSGRNFKVAWSDRFSGWSLETKGWAYAHFFGEALEPEDCEVIGNIFDNMDI